MGEVSDDEAELDKDMKAASEGPTTPKEGKKSEKDNNTKGEKLEGVYELVEVTKDEIVFRNQEKLYKIENLVGINL